MTDLEQPTVGGIGGHGEIVTGAYGGHGGPNDEKGYESAVTISLWLTRLS